VFHNREYLVAIRALDGALALHTMRFAAELVAAKKLDIPRPSRKPTQREVKMAGALVDSLHDKFDPKAFKDTYRQRVLDLIKRKAKGEEIEIPEPEEPEESGDLMAALEASLKGKKSGRSSKRSSKSSRSKAKAKA
jgi:DNA end-binding protein Ku